MHPPVNNGKWFIAYKHNKQLIFVSNVGYPGFIFFLLQALRRLELQNKNLGMAARLPRVAVCLSMVDMYTGLYSIVRV